MNWHHKRLKPFGELLVWIGCAGVVVGILWAIFFICLWRMTPALPDTSHVMEWNDRGRIHYLTAGQYSFYSHFQTTAFIGWFVFIVFVTGGALILRKYEANR